MIAKLAYRGHIVVAACCVAALSGCATTATITTLKPAAADVSDVRRLAVLYCAGPEDSGQIAHSAIVSKLTENGYYSLASPSELTRYAPAPLYNEAGQANMLVAIEAARRMQLDAILAARVKYRREGGIDVGGGTIQFGDPIVTATVDFELADVRTGRVLCRDRSTASYQGELTDDRTGPTSERKVLAKLAREAARKVVDQIAPHHASLDVQLAAPAFGRGAGEVRDGNKLARDGNWAGAIERWQQALDENPESDAAMFNLGLAYEALGSFERARQLYSAAINQADDQLYQEALERVERSSREHQLALAQLHRSVAQSGPR
jgi:tetratricopeptide (TPR) repeat protein